MDLVALMGEDLDFSSWRGLGIFHVDSVTSFRQSLCSVSLGNVRPIVQDCCDRLAIADGDLDAFRSNLRATYGPAIEANSAFNSSLAIHGTVAIDHNITSRDICLGGCTGGD